MIYYSTPYSSERNLGQAYNEFIALLPNATDFACLVDADAMFTTSDYGHFIEQVVSENPACRLFYAVTNRIWCRWQRSAPDPDDDDIRVHRDHGRWLQKKFGTATIERKWEKSPASGFFMLVRKDLWTELGGFANSGMLTVDNDFFRRAARIEGTILQIKGLYLYHWYKGAGPARGKKRRDVTHLTAPALTRISILNSLIVAYGYSSYLEVGVAEGKCFRAVRLPAEAKTGIDPQPTGCAGVTNVTSDDFFAANDKQFDLILIDGLHHADQVYRDIVNALACLRDGGAMVCHDMLPASEPEQRVPRESKHWTGDCWKAWVRLRSERDDLHMEVVKADHGCGIIRRGRQERLVVHEPVTWENFVRHQAAWLNLVQRPTLPVPPSATEKSHPPDEDQLLVEEATGVGAP